VYYVYLKDEEFKVIKHKTLMTKEMSSWLPRFCKQIACLNYPPNPDEVISHCGPHSKTSGPYPCPLPWL